MVEQVRAALDIEQRNFRISRRNDAGKEIGAEKRSPEKEFHKNYTKTEALDELYETDENSISGSLVADFLASWEKRKKANISVFHPPQYFIEQKFKLLWIYLLLAAMIALRWTFLVDAALTLRAGQPLDLLAVGSRLKLDMLEAKITPPAYLPEKKEVSVNLLRQSTIPALAGSEIQILGQKIGFQQGKILMAQGGSVDKLPLKAGKNGNFQVELIAGEGRSAFVLEIEYGNIDTTVQQKTESNKSRVFIIKGKKDEKPEITILAPPDNKDISYGQSLQIRYHANDDLGLLEIYLRHRDPEQDDIFKKKLITRMHNKRKTSILDTFTWNPIFEESGKIRELIYPPGTETIEYYLEVQDINFFSEQNVGQSKIQKIRLLQGFQKIGKALREIKKLHENGQKLNEKLGSQDRLNKELQKEAKKYRKNLLEFQNNFELFYKKILPQDKLLTKSKNLQNIIQRELKKAKRKTDISPALLTSALEQYLLYLQNYLTAIEFHDQMEKNLYFNRSSSGIFSQLNEKLFKREKNQQGLLRRLEKLNRDLDLGRQENLEEMKKALRTKNPHALEQSLRSFFNQSGKKMQSQLKAHQDKLESMTAQMQKLNDLIARSHKKILSEQEKNLKLSRSSRFNEASQKQQKISQESQKWLEYIEKLYEEFPFTKNQLVFQSKTVMMLSQMAEKALQDKQKEESISLQKQIIELLKSAEKMIRQQKNLIKGMRQGDINDFFPNSTMSNLIIIPKEAQYTVPLDLKEKIINLSRKNRELRRNQFWQDLLK